jgi:hypothetical protein
MRPNILAPSVTPMANASTPTNGLKMLVAAFRMSVIDGAVKAGGLLNCIAENLLFNFNYTNRETSRAAM